MDSGKMEPTTHDPGSFPCPCCGFLISTEKPGSYEICDICGWEDDHVQLAHPGLRGGANRRSLREAQQELIQRIPLSVSHHDGYQRDSTWRPLELHEIATSNGPRTGLEYFHAAADSDTPAYYWRKSSAEATA